MDICILDLDAGVASQQGLLPRACGVPGQDWGPNLRLACSFRRFRQFEKALAQRLPDGGRRVVLYGSGDFHHVSLALVRRLREPCNLVVIDNHPDWMQGMPFLHCGTWLYHAARLPQVRRVFHLGGDVDFDNAYRLLAPWSLLRSGKLTVYPARRRFRGWSGIPHQSLRPDAETPASSQRLHKLFEPYRRELAELPLYISLDKDVMVAAASVVNWDSGHLTLTEVLTILDALLQLCHGRLLGMDIVGDWSPVRTSGLFRRLFHWTMHPALAVDPAAVCRRNAHVNRVLLDTVRAGTAGSKAAG